MKLLILTPFLALLITQTTAKIGNLCHTSTGKYGTCQTTAWCRSHEGSLSTTGLCPDDAAGVQCCFKPECLPEHDGWYCDRVESGCPGGSFASKFDCPGPANYRCCR